MEEFKIQQSKNNQILHEQILSKSQQLYADIVKYTDLTHANYIITYIDILSNP